MILPLIPRKPRKETIYSLNPINAVNYQLTSRWPFSTLLTNHHNLIHTRTRHREEEKKKKKKNPLLFNPMKKTIATHKFFKGAREEEEKKEAFVKLLNHTFRTRPLHKFNHNMYKKKKTFP